ncbi:MAG: PhoD-like phosphatase [Phormidesmis sp.]
MEYLAGDDALKALPLLLAGPTLRRTEAAAVTVWVALKQPCRVTLQVLETQAAGHQLDRCVLQGSRETTALGQHLHVVAVSAQGLNGERLKENHIYAYDLQFVADKSYDLSAALARGDRTSQADPTKAELHEIKAVETDASETTETISYFAHQKPTFVLPPELLIDLKIAHGSCRKPHGAGVDALPILDSLLEEKASEPKARPHQLFLTGDQIYGDDVADPLLWLSTALGDTLLGWEELLPIGQPHTDSRHSSDRASRSGNKDKDQAPPNKLPAGQRADWAIRQAGLTAGLGNKRDRTTSHLFSFGEYCAAYLLAYSPACWPVRLPMGEEVTQGRKAIQRWNKDRRHMEQFLHTLWKVRRLMANIATYTIFDDHDVSDDWNLNQAWCLRVLGQPLGRCTVQNALLSYAVFQAWGNTPEQFEAGEVGMSLLLAVQQWSGSAGQDQAASEAIATYLGLPPTDPHTGLPQFVQEQGVWVLQRAEKSLTWHYTVRSACHEVIVLDTRTRRGYPIEAPPIAPPMLLCPSAFHQQLAIPLSNSSPSPNAANRSSYATFVVAPTNVFGMRALDWIQQWHLDQRQVFTADVGDAWNFHDEALATLLITLFRHRQNIVVLSGDIHYSSALRANYYNFASGEQAELVQLTASAIKNEELLTQILHTRLKQWLLPERPRKWVGWSSPPSMTELRSDKQLASSYRRASKRPDEPPDEPSNRLPNRPPDWQCQMNWLRRQPAQPADIKVNLFELVPSRARSRHWASKWLKFWNARWFQEGREVVGINNIALVHFQLQASPAPSQSPDQLTILQDHYWLSPWLPTQVVRNRFE